MKKNTLLQRLDKLESLIKELKDEIKSPKKKFRANYTGAGEGLSVSEMIKEDCARSMPSYNL